MLGAALLLSCWGAGAQLITSPGAAEQALATQFPAQSIDSIERANAALALVPVARAEITLRIAGQRAKCLDNFFTSSCLSDLRESERRAAEQRDKSISITGSARNADKAEAGDPVTTTPPNESIPVDEPRP